MSQPDATLYIQPPIFDTTVAVQISANVRWRKGAHAEGAACGVAAVGDALALLIPHRNPSQAAGFGLGGFDDGPYFQRNRIEYRQYRVCPACQGDAVGPVGRQTQ